MTFIKFEPIRDFQFLENKVQRCFGEFPSNYSYDNTFLPKIDISEDEKNIYFEVEIPGVNKEDINISLEDNILTIKAEKKLQGDKKEKTLIRKERRFNSFTRSFTLHEEINPDVANAEFENGILKITLEKEKHKAIKERQIEIK
jgi:HSP20 family protein